MESDSSMKINSNDATTSHSDKNQLKNLDNDLNNENQDENSNSSLINSSFDLQKSNLNKINSPDNNSLNDSLYNSLSNSCTHKSADKHSNNDSLSNSDKRNQKKATLSSCLGSSSKLSRLSQSNDDCDPNDNDVEMDEENEDEEISEDASKESDDEMNSINEDDDEEEDEYEEDEYEEDDQENECEEDDERMDDELTEEETDKEMKTINNKGYRKSKIGKIKKNKKRKAFYERRNIKKLIKEKDLDETILNARKEEEERIKRILEQQRILKSEQQSQIKTTTSLDERIKDTSADDIVLSSDEEEQTKKEDVELIELSDTEDVIKVYEKIPTEIDSENSGLHTDDSLNVLNKDGRCLINIGHPLADPDIFLDDYLAKKVKPHQIGGVRFMYDCIIEDLKKINRSEGLGCVLSHSMGLGKTLQTIAFVEIFLRATKFKHVLCIVPVNILLNWQTEFDYWLPDEETLNDLKENKENKPSTSKMQDFEEDSNAKLKDEHLNLRKPRTFNIYSLTGLKKFTERASEIAKWSENGGVLLMGYEAYRILFNKKNTEKYNEDEESNEATSSRNSKKPFKLENLSKEEYLEMMQKIRESLVDPGPDLVICDEGHRIKNYKSSISEVLKEIRTKRRVVLTGYPLQNNLIEYWCMVDFIRPGYLGARKEFVNMFERPIENGQCVDSEPGDRILARKRVHVLQKLLRGFVQRRSFTILFKTLPRKQEYCFNIAMTDLQRELLLAFFEYVKKVEQENDSTFGPLKIYSNCYKIWNHTDVLYRKMLEKEGLIDDQPTTSKNNKKKQAKRDEIEDELEDSSESYEWATYAMRNYVPGRLDNSCKFKLLFKIIDETIRIGERLLVFTQSLTTLDIIEDFLSQRKIPNTNGIKFRRNQNYFRLDGSTGPSDRKNYIDTFNSNPNYHLFLISTKAGSLGINLTGANRLIVLDISWNPCFDAQAVHRIFRYGQTRECFVYRFIFDSSLEKKIFDRQIIKQGMSNQVVDHLNTDTNLTWEDITNITKGLCNLEKPPKPEFTDEDLEMYTDPIMKIVCKELNSCFTKKPFLHESLLTESEHHQLTAWEKQLAEREYAIEKRAGLKSSHSLGNQDSYLQNNYNQPNLNPNHSYQVNNQTSYYPNQQQMNSNNSNPIYNNSFNQNLNNNYNNYHPQLNTPQQNIGQNLPHQNHSFNQNNFNNQYQMPSSSYQSNHANAFNTFGNNNNYNYNHGSDIAKDTQQVNNNALIPVSNVQQSLPQQPSSQQQNSYANSNHSQNTHQQQAPYTDRNHVRNTYQNNNSSEFNNTSELNSNNIRREKIRITQRNFIIPQDLRIKDEAGEVINLKKGQLVLLIQSENSLILRTLSGKQVQIRGPFVNYFSMMHNLPAPPPPADTFMRASTSHSNSQPEVISLSDED